MASPRLLRCFLQRWQRNEIALRAAALTYYAVFSVFPLLLLLTSTVGWLLSDPVRQHQAMDTLFSLLPKGNYPTTQLMREIALSHHLPNYLAALTLLWSASGYLRGMLAAIAVVHDGPAAHSGWRMQGWSLLLLALLVPGLLGLSAVLGVVTALLRHLAWLPHWANGAFARQATLWSIGVLAFYALLRFIPHHKSRRRHAAAAALFTATLWWALNLGFGQYLAVNFRRLNFIYGSLAAVVALMLYFYFGNLVILLGAQINALLRDAPHCSP